jgi:quinol-cytochrome oxidoreductase complex cytochrome b subunit
VNPRRKSSLLWGLVGVLLFLVLALGYRLMGGSLPVGVAGLAGIGIGVGGVVAVAATVIEPRLIGKGRT